jgi:hypothetical protein
MLHKEQRGYTVIIAKCMYVAQGFNNYPVSYPAGTGDKAVGAWNWPLTSI